MRTGCRENEALLNQLPIEIQESKYLNEKLQEGDRWISTFQNPEFIKKLMAVTRSIDENHVIHFHKSDIESVLKKENILKEKEKFPFGVEYHKDTKNIYFVLTEKDSQIIAGEGYFVYVKILQNIVTKNFIARKTEIINPLQYQRKLKETHDELQVLYKTYGKQNIAYAFRYTRLKGFFAKLFGMQHAIPHKIDIFMPWIPGIELFDFINNLVCGQRQELLCYKVMLATALELQRFHQLKIIHCDIKPENIKVWIENNEILSLHIFDFNLSLKASRTFIEDGDEVIAAHRKRLHGTPAFLDPRIHQSIGCIYTSKSDTFSLLVILFEMLVRTKPSFMMPSDLSQKEKLLEIRNNLLNLQSTNKKDAIFLSQYVLEKNDPYPTLQTFIKFLRKKIRILSNILFEENISSVPLKHYALDKLGLFGISTNETEESKHIPTQLTIY